VRAVAFNRNVLSLHRSALKLLRTSQPYHPAQKKTLPHHQTQGLHKMYAYGYCKNNRILIASSLLSCRHTPLKKKHEPKHTVRPHSQKKLNSYIHHVVANNLPPTVQVGGTVINSPRLSLPPIPLPYTAPPTISTSKSHPTTMKTTDEEIVVPQTFPELQHTNSITEVTDVSNKDEADHTSQTNSTISVGSTELVPAMNNSNNSNNNNNSTPDNPLTTDQGSKSSFSANERIEAHIKPIFQSSISKIPKKSLGHIKRKPTHSSPQEATCRVIKGGGHKTNDDRSEYKLPVLTNKSDHQSSSFNQIRTASRSMSK